MSPDITNKNLHLLLPGKIVAVACLDAGANNKTPLEALRAFYRSETYRMLEDEETKLWHYGPVALYEEFQNRK